MHWGLIDLQHASGGKLLLPVGNVGGWRSWLFD
jgi:hypothetical protein